MHLAQDLLGKSLGDPKITSGQIRKRLAICRQHLLIDGSGTTSSLDAFLLSLGH